MQRVKAIAKGIGVHGATPQQLQHNRGVAPATRSIAISF